MAPEERTENQFNLFLQNLQKAQELAAPDSSGNSLKEELK